MAGLAGLEPTSQRLPVSTFAFYLYHYNPMVDLTRLELVTSRLSGERSNQLSYRSVVEITRIELVSERFHFGFLRSSNPSIPMGRLFRIELKYLEPQSNVINHYTIIAIGGSGFSIINI